MTTLERGANGRFQPGRSGNPLGKKPGTRNRATILREALRDGEDAGVARVIIDKALAGNAVMARFVIGHLMPRPRDRAIELDLPECVSAEDVLAASSATIQAMAQGKITPQEALTVMRLLEFRLKAIAAARAAERTHFDHKEPSPPGRGQGEGAGGATDGLVFASARRPHRGEGMAGGVREGRGRILDDLLHSTCISRPPIPLPPSLTGVALAA